jgi:UDP-N-acetylglucosamine--N-acetylmuramyl-(pentapeptide) pyrophosphoryl-undecaprenol N-acetylglucosamine transferase
LAMKQLGWRVSYFGAAGEMEEQLTAKYGLEFFRFRFARRPALSRLISQIAAFVWALEALRRVRARVVFSKGSSVSTPVVLAASLLRIPIILHESDAVPGTETILVQRLASAVCVGYPEAARALSVPVIVTGNPPGPNAMCGNRETARRIFAVDFEKPILFVTGGSQGAASLNRLLWPILETLTERYSVIHQCGPGKKNTGLECPDYCAVEFLHEEMRHAYAASDVVLGRAGATTIAEVSSYRIPALYVPYPWAESDHQMHNARLAHEQGGCEVLRQDELNPTRLLEAIDRMMLHRDSYHLRYQQSVSSAKQRIAGLINDFGSAAAEVKRQSEEMA